MNVKIEPETPMYRLAGVSKVYRKGSREIPAVRDLDLEIRAGEWLAVQGKTGHGKTTLLQLPRRPGPADAGPGGVRRPGPRHGHGSTGAKGAGQLVRLHLSDL